MSPATARPPKTKSLEVSAVWDKRNRVWATGTTTRTTTQETYKRVFQYVVEQCCEYGQHGERSAAGAAVAGRDWDRDWNQCHVEERAAIWKTCTDRDRVCATFRVSGDGQLRDGVPADGGRSAGDLESGEPVEVALHGDAKEPGIETSWQGYGTSTCRLHR